MEGPRGHGGGQPKRKPPQPGDGVCPQCRASDVKVTVCQATGLGYCSQWGCMKAAGVPSVVNPPKRSKKNIPPVELDEAAAAALAAATDPAQGSAAGDAAAEEAELEEELAALMVLLRRCEPSLGEAVGAGRRPCKRLSV